MRCTRFSIGVRPTAALWMLLGCGSCLWAQSPETPRENGAAEPPRGELRAAGHEHLWIVRHDGKDQFAIEHRAPEDKPNTIYQVVTATGKPVKIAARDQRLYILYQDRSAQTIVFHAPRPPEPRSFETRQLPPLPVAGRVAGWAALSDGPFVILRSADRTEAPSASAANLQLLALQRNRWHHVTLPPTVRPDRFGELIALDGQRLGLVEVAEDRASLLLHEFEAAAPTPPEPNEPNDAANSDEGGPARPVLAGTWRRQRFEVDVHPRAAAVGLGQSLILVRPDAAQSDRFELLMLRNGKANTLGHLSGLRPDDQWMVCTYDDRVTVLMVSDDGSMRWAQRGLEESDDVLAEAAPLELSQPEPMALTPSTLLLVGALVVSMAVIMGTTRGDPKLRAPRLPEGVRPALLSRAGAAVVDILPPLLVGAYVAWALGLNDPKSFYQWTQDPTDWRKLMPFITLVSLHVGHTGISELLTGTTLGKAIFGCRVVDLEGRKPQVQQILIRNLFKAIELMLPPLLVILPLLSSYHQRLGDFIARTLVVERKTPPRTGIDERS